MSGVRHSCSSCLGLPTGHSCPNAEAEATPIASTLLSSGPAAPQLAWSSMEGTFSARSADQRFDAFVVFDASTYAWRVTLTHDHKAVLTDIRDGRVEAMLVCEEAIERLTILFRGL